MIRLSNRKRNNNSNSAKYRLEEIEFGMSKPKHLPVVAICGRPNVGKSTLHNRITGKQRAIIHNLEGITRDRHSAKARWNEYAFELIDTGGIVEHPEDEIVQKMQEQVRMALEDATVIVFVVDGQQELTRVDYELRDELFKFGKPVVLVTNKLDNDDMEVLRHNFHELGMGEPMAVSSGHGLGMDDLMTAITSHLPKVEHLEEEPEDDGRTKVAVIGKPNVGKSSFVNALLGEERAIVHETAGTTRDAIDIDFQWEGRDYVLIDTAGMRKKAGIREMVEHFSVARSLRAVRRADVCLVMIDATEGVSEQDKRILGYVYEQGTGMVLVYTKWDLIEDKEERFQQLQDELDFKMPHLKYIPHITVSNLTRLRLLKSFDLIDRIAISAEKRISTNVLNRFVQDLKDKHKPSGQNGKYAKILYMTQASTKPTTFVLFVNQKRLFHFSYLRFIENQLRAEYEFEGVPIHLELREETPEKSK